MNPPIREARHRDGRWRAVTNGIVDVVGSDHARHTIEEKSKPYPQSPSGMPGVQTLLPLLLMHHAAQRLSLGRIADLTAHGPARIYNIAGKGRIAVGYDADLVFVDLAAQWQIEREWLTSKCGWSPFEGFQMKGKVLHTILRGEIMVQDGALCGSMIGRPVRFSDTNGARAG